MILSCKTLILCDKTAPSHGCCDFLQSMFFKGDIMLQKRLLTVQDISCLGKCSLTAAIPIISAFGIEPVVLPTAVLSTHTGAGFEGYSFNDLTDHMPAIGEHWKSLNIEFDAMYSGYLGSIRQLDIVKKLFTEFKTENNLVFVDPVMGDEGRLYSGFDESFAQRMHSLCAHADIICPNVTEACCLTGIEYREAHNEAYIKALAEELCNTGAKTIIITGVSVEDKFGAMCLDAVTGKTDTYLRPKIPGCYYGTGDIFASVLCSALTYGFSLEQSLHTAIDFVYESILATQDEKDKYYYGVKFEQCLYRITDMIKRRDNP